MYNLPVHWSEGLFLRPHHFQAADRHWSEVQHTSEQWDHPYNYGIRKLELSQDAIANYQLQVNALDARMRDGTLVAIDPGQGMDRVELKEAFGAESVVRVFLAVPKLKLGAANVADPTAPGRHRYLARKALHQDESCGGNEQEIDVRDLNVRLLLSTQDCEGYELLPIAQVQRAGEKEAAPRLDADYIPPLLAVDAWPPLGRDIVRAIYDIIGKRIEVLSAQVVNRGISLVSQEPGDLDRLLMLHQLNAAYAALGILAFASGVHPLTAYVELCRIVGQLAIFSPERRAAEIPNYDHDDLATIFRSVKARIELLLGGIPDYQYEQRFFVGEGKGMRVTIESRWLNTDWRWFVGVMRGNLSETDCLGLLRPGGMNWKLGSARQVDSLFEHGQEGLTLTQLPQAPRALPPSRDWMYFEVSRQNAAWRDVLDTQTLAMRLRDNLIVNRSELQGERNLVVSAAGKQVALQFALFAVPKQS
jgi:type VI secretion system protein ImpJ